VAEELYVLPSSFGQERMWLVEQVQASAAHNVMAVVRISGPLDIPALSSALSKVVARHEVLRSVLRLDGAGVVQVVRAAEPVELEITPVTGGLDAALAEAEGCGGRLFELSEGPLMHSHVLRLSAEDHVLVMVLHHAVADGWSLGVLLRELEVLYAAAREGGGGTLPELPVQYADYAVWQREQLSSGTLDSQLSYWRQRLAGASALHLQADAAEDCQVAQATLAAVSAGVEVPAPVIRQLRVMARSGPATAFMVALAGFGALLMRWSGQPSVIVGVPVAGRTEVDLEPLIGFFVNTLPVRLDLSGDPTFADLIEHVREMSINAYGNAELPFEVLVDQLRPERRAGHLPLAQAMLAVNIAPPVSAAKFSGLTLEPLALRVTHTEFDVMADLTEHADALSGSLTLRADMFTQRTADLAAASLQTLLRAAAAAPHTRIFALPCPVTDECASWARPAPGEGGAVVPGDAAAIATQSRAERGNGARDSRPSSVKEHLLARLWAEVLELDGIGVDDEFYASGGNSLRAVLVVLRSRELGLDLPVELVLGEHTIRELAAAG
jgi:hypothetical protein